MVRFEKEKYADIPEDAQVPESKRLFMARRRQQKRMGKDVYDRRKEFFIALHAGEGKDTPAPDGASGLSENDRRKARRVRERSPR